jgi:hypothetical protein
MEQNLPEQASVGHTRRRLDIVRDLEGHVALQQFTELVPVQPPAPLLDLPV